MCKGRGEGSQSLAPPPIFLKSILKKQNKVKTEIEIISIILFSYPKYSRTIK
jgi:hypothetical protein